VSGTLFVRNRQANQPVNLRLFRQVAKILLRDLLGAKNFDLGIYLVAEDEMTRLNETFLRHKGSTDVITFDYAEPAPDAATRASATASVEAPLNGEVFICADEAVVQAKIFRTTWEQELVRYLIHGVLHLCGHDDRSLAARKRMKKQENRLLRKLSSRCDLRRLRDK
jgi:probable rRNA maturation factor